MDFRIADTFTDSMGKLSADERKAVKVTVFDLQTDLSNPGLKLHRLNHSKDPGFWSARVNDGLRVIIHRRDPSVLICYVGTHEDSYLWAERRKLAEHPDTGAITFIEVEKKVQEVLVPVYVEDVRPAPCLFDGVTDDRLLSVGVPANLISTVRGLTEATILTLCERLPTCVAESLLDMAAGTVPDVPEGTVNAARTYIQALDEGSKNGAWRFLSLAVGFLDPASTVDTYPWTSLRSGRLRSLQQEIANHYNPTRANTVVQHIQGLFLAGMALGVVSLSRMSEIRGVRPLEISRAPKLPPAKPEDPNLLMSGALDICLEPPLDIGEAKVMQWLHDKELFKIRELQRHFGNNYTSDFFFSILNRLSRRNIVRRNVPRVGSNKFESWSVNPRLRSIST